MHRSKWNAATSRGNENACLTIEKANCVVQVFRRHSFEIYNLVGTISYCTVYERVRMA